MSNHRNRRGHVLPPSRKVRRQSLVVVVRREYIDHAASDTNLDVMFSLTPQGRRAILEDLRDRLERPW